MHRNDANRFDPVDVALQVLEYGTPYRAHQLNDEAYTSYEYLGVRWGQVHLEITPNGSLSLFRDKNRDGYPNFWSLLYNSQGASLSHVKNTALVSRILGRVYALHGRRYWGRGSLPGDGTLQSRQERIESLRNFATLGVPKGSAYNPDTIGL